MRTRAWTSAGSARPPARPPCPAEPLDDFGRLGKRTPKQLLVRRPPLGLRAGPGGRAARCGQRPRAGEGGERYGWPIPSVRAAGGVGHCQELQPPQDGGEQGLARRHQPPHRRQARGALQQAEPCETLWQNEACRDGRGAAGHAGYPSFAHAGSHSRAPWPRLLLVAGGRGPAIGTAGARCTAASPAARMGRAAQTVQSKAGGADRRRSWAGCLRAGHLSAGGGTAASPSAWALLQGGGEGSSRRASSYVLTWPSAAGRLRPWKWTTKTSRLGGTPPPTRSRARNRVRWARPRRNKSLRFIREAGKRVCVCIMQPDIRHSWCRIRRRAAWPRAARPADRRASAPRARRAPAHVQRVLAPRQRGNSCCGPTRRRRCAGTCTVARAVASLLPIPLIGSIAAAING